jgi:hypothetical protein
MSELTETVVSAIDDCAALGERGRCKSSCGCALASELRSFEAFEGYCGSTVRAHRRSKPT